MPRTFNLGAIFAVSVAAACAPAGVSGSAQAPPTETAASAEILDPGLPRYRQPGVGVVDRCGDTWDFVDVEYFPGKQTIRPQFARSHEPTTVMFRWLPPSALQAAVPGGNAGDVGGQNWCTGTLIDATHVLTAAHCFAPQRPDPNRPDVLSWTTPSRADGTQLQDEELAPLMVVVFGYQRNRVSGVAMQGQTFAVAGITETGGGTLDFAVVELNANSGQSLDRGADGRPLPVVPLSARPTATVLNRNPSPRQQIAIIQHPDGMLKQIDVGTVEDFLVEWGQPHFRYTDIDTNGGASGSGVRDAQGRIVGVHVAGGCTTRVNGPIEGNRAVPIEAILGASPYVRRLAQRP